MDYTTTEKWSSLDEIAEHLGISKDTIYRWFAENKCPLIKSESYGNSKLVN
jgi:excisionase family DNA binding protein